MAEEPAPPELVGGFRVLRRLGSGGMGSVFEGEEPNIERRVAIKILRAHLADDPNFVERFRMEARLANSVAHPAIVDVFSFGRLDDGRPYFVMPLLEGESLRELLDREHELATPRAWAIAREVAAALAAAHAAGLVHRDLKPDNVFLERKGDHERVRVMDFGIAKSLVTAEGSGDVKTESGMLLGTPAYMAPEQWWGAKLDARVDQYALGAMLFEMLSGRPPFDPNHESGVMRLHLHEKPPTLDERGADALIQRLLAKEPGDRFESMAEAIAAGDAVFGEAVDMGSAPTELGEPPGESIDLRKRWLASHFACIALSIAAMLAVGYAGTGRWSPREWFVISGFIAYPVVAAFVIAAALLPVLVLARDGSRRFRKLALALALAPGVLGALGTYLNWQAVARAISVSEVTKRFELFNEGSYEAGAARFLGFGLATGLLLSLSGTVALAPSHGADARDRKLANVLDASVVICAILAALLGAPSTALVALVALVFLWLGTALPITRDDVSAEVERTVYAAFALFFASGAALERVAARRSVLWTEGLDRAARVQEIMAADRERTATFAVILFSCLVVLGAQTVRLRDASDLGPRFVRHWPLAAVLVAVLGSDLFLSAKFDAMGRATREALASQFALFAELDPPSTRELAGPEFAPSGGPALQVAQTAVAVDGREVARLNAIGTSAGKTRLEDALFEALARASDAPLSCLVDRRVVWSEARELLSIARVAGATEAELLFTRGQAPELPRLGPPETGWVTGSDFVAVRVELADDGLELDGAKRFGDLAPGLLAAAKAGRAPALAVPLPATAGRDPGR